MGPRWNSYALTVAMVVSLVAMATTLLYGLGLIFERYPVEGLVLIVFGAPYCLAQFLVFQYVKERLAEKARENPSKPKASAKRRSTPMREIRESADPY